jgi:ribosomal protein S27AE
MYSGRTTNIFDNDMNISSFGSSDAGAKADAAQREIIKLRASLGKSMLICEALWEILRDKAKLTDDDLHNKMHEIDMRDGTLDGKNVRKAVDCPDCGRKVSARHPMCIYCGKVIDTTIFTVD